MLTFLRTTWYRCPRGWPGRVPTASPGQGDPVEQGRGAPSVVESRPGPNRFDAGALDDVAFTAAEGEREPLTYGQPRDDSPSDHWDGRPGQVRPAEATALGMEVAESPIPKHAV